MGLLFEGGEYSRAASDQGNTVQFRFVYIACTSCNSKCGPKWCLPPSLSFCQPHSEGLGKMDSQSGPLVPKYGLLGTTHTSHVLSALEGGMFQAMYLQKVAFLRRSRDVRLYTAEIQNFILKGG